MVKVHIFNMVHRALIYLLLPVTLQAEILQHRGEWVLVNAYESSPMVQVLKGQPGDSDIGTEAKAVASFLKTSEGLRTLYDFMGEDTYNLHKVQLQYLWEKNLLIVPDVNYKCNEWSSVPKAKETSACPEYIGNSYHLIRVKVLPPLLENKLVGGKLMGNQRYYYSADNRTVNTLRISAILIGGVYTYTDGTLSSPKTLCIGVTICANPLYTGNLLSCLETKTDQI